MIAGIADTQAAIWYLYSDSRLGRAASDFIEATIVGGDHIGISSIVLQEVPLDAGIVASMKEVARDEIPDLPDRIIAATAKYYGVPILSRDNQIRSSVIKTVW